MTPPMRGGFGVPVFERVARAVGYVALALALALAVVRVVRPDWLRPDPAVSIIAVRITSSEGADTLADALARTLSQRIVQHARQYTDLAEHGAWPTVATTFSVVPSVGVRGVLGAAVAAGLPVLWRDSTGVKGFAMSAMRVPGPASQTVLSATATSSARASANDVSAVGISANGASPNGERVAQSITIRDRGGLLDSVARTDTAIRLRARQLSGPVSAQLLRDGILIASAQHAEPTNDTVRAVRVYAQIGWEAKFVTAALEESGWYVDGSVAVAPRAQVRTGTTPTLDTSRYSAVIVLDSGVVAVRTLRAFADQGGGVVVSGNALRDPAVAALASVTVRGERLAIAGALLSDHPRRGLAALQLVAQRGAVPLEADGPWSAVVVSRVGVGRVLASGYHGTWHWRMEGTDGSAADHRSWWTNVVSTVAFAPAAFAGGQRTYGSPPVRDLPGSVAPVADMHAQLGAPVAAFPRAKASRAVALPPLWLLVCIGGVALLTEWTMRRLRGAR